MQPVQIDVVGLQTPKRVFTLPNDSFAARAACIGITRIQVAAELGGEHQPVAPRFVAPNVIANDLFRVALGVKVGGVEEVAAEFGVTVDDLLRLFDARAPAEIFAESHGAQAKWAYAQAGTAQSDIVVEGHAVLLFWCYY